MPGRPEEELWQPGHTAQPGTRTFTHTAPQHRARGFPHVQARGGVQSKITAQKAIVLCR